MKERPRRTAPRGLGLGLGLGLAALAALAGGCAFEPDGVEIQLSDGSLLEFPAELVQFPNDRGELLDGVLVTPEGETPQSAVVILHGSGGLFSTPDRDDTKLEVDHHFSDWTDLLARQGHAVLLPSSFYSRGYFEWDDAPRSVDEVDRLIMRTHDAYGALHYMCDQPFVDCDRVGLLGFSNGASTTMMSVFDGVDDVAGMHSLEDPAVRARFTVAYAYYPGCGQQGLIEGMRYFPMAPLSIFHGSEDPIVEHCTARLDEAIDEAELRGLSEPPMSLSIYGGVDHGFDGDPANAAEVAARDESRSMILQGFADTLRR